MPVFRVERNTGYTVMSNHHLRNKELTLKAKGLLSQMLSLPEDWDYTLAGLSHINREKIDAIREAVKELEKAGYIVRSRERDEKGRLRGADYIIYEQPQLPEEQPPKMCIRDRYKDFKRIAASIGRPDARFHDLRHSYAVAAIRSGDDIKTVQGNLGHATAAFTLDVYGRCV